jgi:hypothetical protein
MVQTIFLLGGETLSTLTNIWNHEYVMLGQRFLMDISFWK